MMVVAAEARFKRRIDRHGADRAHRVWASRFRTARRPPIQAGKTGSSSLLWEGGMDKTAATMLMIAASFSASLSVAETALDRTPVRDVPVQQGQRCMSLDSYNEAAVEATKRTDWGSVPDANSIPEGTRSLMGEFVVYKDMQRTRTPPCPDLAEAHAEVRAIAPPAAAAARS